MKLCECGCGTELINEKCRFLLGHHNRVFDIKEKKKQTCLKHFGVEYPGQSEKIKQKKKKICMRNYGVDSPSKLDITKEKCKKACLKKYGFDNIFKNVKYIKQCTFKKFGVDNFSKTDQGRLFHRETAIKRIENQKLNGEPLTPRIGDQERIFLSEIEKCSLVKFLRNQKRFGYFPDGLIETQNLKVDIEYDEDDHKYQKKYDQRRDQVFINNGYKVFRIKESEWKRDKQKIINEFKMLIESLKNV